MIKARVNPNSGWHWVYYWAIALIGAGALCFQLYVGVEQTEKRFDQKIQTLSEGVRGSFYDMERHLKESYNFLLLHYGQNPQLTELVHPQNRQALYDFLKPEYDAMRQLQPNLFVMHFIDPNNVTILRMHRPEFAGDDLTEVRPIVVAVNQSRKQASGFETGRNGFAYRITSPLFDADKHYLGVLEFGVRPEYFIHRLNHQFAIKSQVLVKSEKLQPLEHKATYPIVGDYSVVYTDPIFNHLPVDENKVSQLIHRHDRTYLVVTGVHLGSFDGEPVAKFQMLEDITDFYQTHLRNLWGQIILGGSALLVFLVLLYLILRSYSRRLVATLDEIDVLQHKNKVIKHASEVDELTKAYNRRYFNKQLYWLIQQLDRREPVSILFYDIDHFKKINDTHGHLVGDEILKGLTRFVRNHIRSDDDLIRWGGEEFAVILRKVGLREAVEKAEALRLGVEQITWTHDIKFTISISVVQLHAQHTPKDVQGQLDKLLYQAKQSGRNRVEH
ncbi:sensor domain-containing diguanylate cyclase [Hydrogenovibrio thermophilus]|uniref:diguanylate cyclase n=1 Tax=Hydrogenovibrio thermophilus TaxID=265883 RepID=A0A410H231_9GAMM|nr:diguanylate cyclase [Hydrogenovibrio thermophilus]QAB14979.1 diguanylate cyclase [Hydrogenovibrio thermophilus]